jgi:hypothetical protein
VPDYLVKEDIFSFAKIYPDGARYTLFREAISVDRHDYDEARGSTKRKRVGENTKTDVQAYVNRAKTNVIDISLCNSFDLYITFTFAKDRFDIDRCKRRMAYWLNNQRIKYGKFGYLIVAEQHKDGALHFHALFMGYKGKIVDSGVRRNGKPVYNIESYRAGFTTAQKIDSLDKQKITSYIAKYITKDMPTFRNKQRYWCSNGLKRPLKIKNPKLTPEIKRKFEPVYKDDYKEIWECFSPLPDNEIAYMADYGIPSEDNLRVERWE